MNQLIIDEARKWIGTPFRHHGRDAQGIDCAGLLYVVYSAIGAIDDFIAYSSTPETGFVFRSIRNYADRIIHDNALAGDIVLLNFAGSSTHFGIYTGTTVIHADSNLKRVVEHSLPAVANGRAVAFFRMRGING